MPGSLGGYSGQLERHVANLPRHRQVELGIVKRSDNLKGFKVLPKRWIVERIIGWLIRNRRLVRDARTNRMLSYFQIRS